MQRARPSIRYSSGSQLPLYLPHRSFLPARPRVNVYLCIKQALFIRPMNMHCLVAVARCRVQTRRYHCLINHIQSHRVHPVWLPFPPPPHFPRFRRALSARVPRSPLSSPLSWREDPPCHPSELSAHSPSSRVIALAPLLAPLRAVRSSRYFSSRPVEPQLTLIYVIFSGRPHVTALQRTLDQACPMWVRNTRGDAVRECNGDDKGSERKRDE